jgi:hypothetical protein
MGRAGDSIYDDVNPGTADITKLSWVVKDASGVGTASKEMNAQDFLSILGIPIPSVSNLVDEDGTTYLVDE